MSIIYNKRIKKHTFRVLVIKGFATEYINNKNLAIPKTKNKHKT